MEDKARKENELARNGSNRGTLPQVVERGDRYGVDQQLADVGRYLNPKYPSIVAPQPPACRF